MNDNKLMNRAADNIRIPVSYTHLDVYKRQDSICFLNSLHYPNYKVYMRPFTVKQWINGTSVKAVSYTHLEYQQITVYKFAVEE